MRSLFLALAAFFCTSNAALAAPRAAGQVEFEVFRNGHAFGRHTVNVTAASGGFTVRNSVALRVRAGPVTVYRYEQTCAENWRSGAVEALNCSTLKDGRRTNVNRDEAGMPWPTTWWTRPPAGVTSMLNTETGAVIPVRISNMGRETLTIGGARVAADRVRVQGSLVVDLWYDEEGRWVGCAFTARNQRITYRLASARSAAPA